jgi:hypothetical protein
MHKRGDMYPVQVILSKTWQRGMRAALQRMYGHRLLEWSAQAAVWAHEKIDYLQQRARHTVRRPRFRALTNRPRGAVAPRACGCGS